MPSRILRDWTDSMKLDGISAESERLFVRLIMKADDFGRFHAEPRLVKAGCFPLENAIRLNDLIRWLDELSDRQLILRYELNGRKFLALINWGQRLRNTKARFPQPLGESEEWIPQSGQSAASCGNLRQSAANCGELRQSAASCGELRPDLDSDSDLGSDHDNEATPEARHAQERERERGAKAGGKFCPPTREELNEASAKLDPPLPPVEVDKFVGHYGSKGWMVGTTKMKSWPHALAGWHARWRERNENGFGCGQRTVTGAQARKNLLDPEQYPPEQLDPAREARF